MTIGAYRAERKQGDRGYPRGPLCSHDDFRRTCAIGFCPKCGTNARKTTQVRGLFHCPTCDLAWHDSRVGQQPRSFDDYFDA